ncbi:polymorphic toxin-type HINT domain-containing protein [Streptomyces beijiangensis]|uniref:polymorphic toxin-type HINT domain-containing protein n=1 Tax=Streptomyces beijiangensis TaxID=163361 RepID=UPI00360FE0C7
MVRTVRSRWGAHRESLRWRSIAGLIFLALISALLGTPSAAAASGRAGAPAVSRTKSVSGGRTLATKKIKVTDQAKRPYRPAAPQWPGAEEGAAALAGPAGGAQHGAVSEVKGTPVWARSVAPSKGAYQGPGSVSVRVLPHQNATKLGVTGVVFTVGAGSSGRGDVQVGLDYGTFAESVGGNYASRLHLVKLPACALTDPERAACRKQTPVPTHRNASARELATTLTLGSARPVAPRTTAAGGSTVTQSAYTTPAFAGSEATVLAATTGAGADGGEAGSFGATALAPSGSWSGGGSAGAFTYKYPIALAGSSGGLKPSVGLSYNSGSVDGKTSSTQAQSSWAGDGWNTPDSYIEQSFASCSDSPEGSASPVASGDECYDGPVLTLSLNGSTTALVKDSSGAWTPAEDNGSIVSHITGSNNGTGTYNSDYWTVTERDGTRYEFGRNQLPGWSSGKPVTNSVDSEPVYSAHSGDPCYDASGFASSVCKMAYKWHLDYVVDTDANAVAYYYGQDTNYYGENKGANNVSYVRDSYLNRIDYGFRNGGAYGTVPDQVFFTTARRCTLTTCDALSASTAAAQYPDVPFDLVCASGAKCTSQSPSFFSTVRLSSITVKQYSVASAKYLPVDTYTLHESEPATGDGTSPTLWLSSITHEGDDTTAGGSTSPVALPDVKFTAVDLQNRVNTSSFPGLYRFRIASVTNEMGGVTSVSYGLPDACTASYVASATPSSNTKSCYPVSWTPRDYEAPITDWFEKYAVTQVLESDTTGGAVAKQTDYTYNGGAAWHHDDNEVVKAKYRTWGQFRGYASVETQTGDGANDPKTESVTSYYRGMDGDWLSSSGTRSVSVTDSQGGTHTDSDQLASMPLESTTYKGTGGAVDQSTVTSYWVSAPTATRTRAGLPDLTANATATAESWNRQAITDGGTTTWRYTETDNTFEVSPSDANFGLVKNSYTHTVPVNSAYDQCTTTIYAKPNTGLNLVGLIASTEKDSVACSGFTENSPATVPKNLNTLDAPTTVKRPDQVVSATESFYDDPAFATTFPQNAAPTSGNATMIRAASGYSGGFTWQTQSRTTYDPYGRPLDTYDAAGNKTITTYTVDSVGLTTGAQATNPKAQSTSSTLDPTRGLTLTATDANKITSTVQYDALGRTTAIWEHNRTTSAPADAVYTYTVTPTGLSGTTTKELNDSLGYATSVSVVDSLGRDRQTQSPTPQGGRLITESFYDSHGWVRKKNNSYWDSAATPTLTGTLTSFQDSEIPNQDLYTFDGLGRVVVDDSEQYSNPDLKRETTTVYNGDSTTVIPPNGGTVKSARTDAAGRSSEIDSYSGKPTLTKPSNTFTGNWFVTGGTSNAITYGYDGHDKQNTTTSGGSTWSTTYDLLGRATVKTDPDAGATHLFYDANGNLTQSTDARTASTSFTYDVLNRKTGQYASTTDAQTAGAGGNQMAGWVYDNDNAVTGVNNAIGQATTVTAYNSGSAYVTQQLNFNAFGESLGESVTIPAALGALGGKTYTFKHTYSADTGLPYSDNYPLGGGLPNEIVSRTYSTALDLPNGLGSTSYGYAQGTTYSAYGQVLQETLGSGTNLAYLTNAYDPHTGALTDQLVTRSTATPAKVDEQAYAYDLAGNLTKQTSTRLGATAATEAQCYQYDQLDRLTQAWTATDSCAATPTTANHATVGDQLAGGAAYWTTWSLDLLGQRKTQVDHSTTGGTDTTTSYIYDGNGKKQPHTLTGTQDTGASNATTSATYDDSGNTLTRNTVTSGNQTLNWNNAGQLTQISGGKTGTTSYIYDAYGQVLAQTDPSSTTLYLPGEELTLTGTTTTGVRHIPLPGGGTVVRTGTSTNYKFQFSDQHGTSGLLLDNTAQTPTWRQFTPYGDSRGTTVTWTDSRGFLNAPNNTNTGLTLLGIREYDPTLGRFISLDPLFEATDDQLLNGYSYTSNNPIGQSDPTGLCPRDLCDGYGQNPGQAQGTHATPSDSKDAPDSTVVDQDLKLPPGFNNGHPEKFLKAYFKARKHWVLHDGHPNPVDEYSAAQEACLSTKGACTSRETLQFGMLRMIALTVIAMTVGGGERPGSGENMRALWKGLLPNGGVARGLKQYMTTSNYSACSFSPETPVLMAMGKTKPIGKIEVGDEVEAADPATGKHQGTRTVQATWTNHDDDLIDLTINTGHGSTAIVHTTSKHPFWDDSAHKWIPAGRLTPGHALNTPGNGHASVVSTHVTPGSANRWNVTVEQLHTYYVLAGETPVLVHNACPLKLEGVDDYLHEQVQKVVDAYDETGAPPSGVMQGGANPDNVGVYRGHNIPGGGSDKPFGYWTEMDVWPTEPGGRRGGMGRIVIGERGETWYTPHYKPGTWTLIREGCSCGRYGE